MKTKKPLRVPKEGFIKTLNKIYYFSQNKPWSANFIIFSSKINKKNLVLEKNSCHIYYYIIIFYSELAKTNSKKFSLFHIL